MDNKVQTTQDTIEYYKERNEKLEMDKEALEAKLNWYEEQFRLSQQQRFGSSSEKTNLSNYPFSMKLRIRLIQL